MIVFAYSINKETERKKKRKARDIQTEMEEIKLFYRGHDYLCRKSESINQKL